MKCSGSSSGTRSDVQNDFRNNPADVVHVMPSVTLKIVPLTWRVQALPLILVAFFDGLLREVDILAMKQDTKCINVTLGWAPKEQRMPFDPRIELK